MKKNIKNSLKTALELVGVFGGITIAVFTYPYVSKYIINPIMTNLKESIAEHQGRTTYASIGDFNKDSKTDMIIYRSGDDLTLSGGEAYIGIGNGKLIPCRFAERLAAKKHCSVEGLVRKISGISDDGEVKFKGK